MESQAKKKIFPVVRARARAINAWGCIQASLSNSFYNAQKYFAWESSQIYSTALFRRFLRYTYLSPTFHTPAGWVGAFGPGEGGIWKLHCLTTHCQGIGTLNKKTSLSCETNRLGAVLKRHLTVYATTNSMLGLSYQQGRLKRQNERTSFKI